MFQWLQGNEAALWWIGLASGATLLVTLIAVPWFLVRIPSDYFVRDNRRGELRFDAGHALRSLWLLGRNVFGLLLVIAGVLMLVLPGQGLVVILIGIMLMSFPGKQKLERWIVTRPSVLRSINWLRRRMGRAPLVAHA
jgi:hypothetical protein